MECAPACLLTAFAGLLMGVPAAPLTAAPALAGVEVVNARTELPMDVPASEEWAAQAAALLPHLSSPEGQERLIDALLEHFRVHGYPVMEVEANPPPRDGGLWQIRAYPGEISGMSLTGGTAWMRAALAPDWARKIGQPLYLPDVEEWLDWTHRNPFHQATLAFTPGADPATAEGLVTLHSTRWASGYVQWRNDGVEPLGQHRFTAGFEAADIFGLPFYLNAEVMTDESFFDLLGARGLLRWFLPWHHELRLAGGWTRADVDGLLPGFQLTSSLHTWDISARYFWPLAQSARHSDQRWRLEGGLGADFRHTVSRLSLEGLMLEGSADTLHLVAELNVHHRGPRHRTALVLQGFFSPGGLTGEDTDAARSVLRTGAEGDYLAARADLWTRFDLSHGWALDMRATGQWSDAPLLATEQLSLTGATGVRGYEEASTLADTGAWMRLELHAPVWTYSTLATRPLAFFDAGWGRDEYEKDTSTLAAAGLGVRAQLTTRASFSLDYGWRLTEPGGRAHVTFRLDF